MSVTGTLNSLWQVIAVGLVLGAGIPAVFAVSLKLLYGGALGVDEHGETTTAAPSPARRVAAYACFALVIAAVAAGIAAIVLTGGH
ncbi:hypothetical protein [Tomitella fengzijianii]|uniref:Uncharacterized protein n=1 Tax=Tomitella fengzijianii TaxID=2597660 RepID=A0A516X0J8_9ACTN|nr:hypothetical protein [Tomitella fengzijianii]QDQ96527.1 hypothetical protein FO059_03210 [Tomitella fengzijianii]